MREALRACKSCERLAIAEERIRQLEQLLVDTGAWWPPSEWGLTWREAMLLKLLIARPIATREAIIAVWQKDDRDDLPTLQSCDVVLVALRRALAHRELAIETVRSVGFRLAEPDRARLRKLIETGRLPKRVKSTHRLDARHAGLVRRLAQAGRAPSAIATLTSLPLALVERTLEAVA